MSVTDRKLTADRAVLQLSIPHKPATDINEPVNDLRMREFLLSVDAQNLRPCVGFLEIELQDNVAALGGHPDRFDWAWRTRIHGHDLSA